MASPLVASLAALGLTLAAAPPARPTPPALADTRPVAPAATPESPARPATEAAAEARHEGGTWFALPVLFWLPETRLGLGATGGLHFAREGAPRPSSVFLAAVYTLEKQGSLDVAWDVYGGSGALLAGRTRIVHFPDVFYGIGPDTRSGDRERFTRRFAEGVVSFEVPVPAVPALRLGPRLDLRAEEIRDRTPGGALDAGVIEGWNGYSAISVGGGVTWDTRDGTFWPRRGTLAQAWYVFAPDVVGDHATFGRGVLELRHFLPLGRRGVVLGLHGQAEGVHGDPPFTLLPKLGSTRFLRGIREGRYRDRFLWATQAELRVPIRGRFSATAFGAIGDVSPDLGRFEAEHVKVAGGAGLRIRLTDQGANIRIDGAVSRFGPELYVLVLEAF